MGPPSGTVEVLPGLRNTANRIPLEELRPFLMSAAAKGEWAEAQVIRHFKKFKLLHQRLRTPFAEVDLVFQMSPREVLMVEVKALRSFDFLPQRISTKQKQRIFRARTYYQEKFRSLVVLNWAFVNEVGDVLVIDDVHG